MLALCLSQLKRLPEATDEARQAVGLAPDVPFTHYALAQVLTEPQSSGRGGSPRSIRRSRLTPHNPSYLALLAAIYYNLRQWPAALDAAERGLAILPEHERCVNIRAMALVKLGRRDEAGAAIGADAAAAKSGEDAPHACQPGLDLPSQGRSSHGDDPFPRGAPARAGIAVGPHGNGRIAQGAQSHLQGDACLFPLHGPAEPPGRSGAS